MTHKEKRDKEAKGEILMYLLVIFIFSPGMFAMSIISPIFGGLSHGSMWIFSILLSLAYFGALWRMFHKDTAKAVKYYTSTCGIIVALLFLCHFVFKMPFPTQFLRNFF